jgi:hypothetical protein
MSKKGTGQRHKSSELKLAKGHDPPFSFRR